MVIVKVFAIIIIILSICLALAVFSIISYEKKELEEFKEMQAYAKENKSRLENKVKEFQLRKIQLNMLTEKYNKGEGIREEEWRKEVKSFNKYKKELEEEIEKYNKKVLPMDIIDFFYK